MTYRITSNIIIPFNVIPLVQFNGNKIEAIVRLKSIYEKSLFTTSLTLKLPVPKNSANVHSNSNIGRAKYDANESAVVWRCKKIPGDSEF